MAIALEDPPDVRLADEVLVARYRAGEPDALDVLLQRYRRFAQAKARGYFLVSAD